MRHGVESVLKTVLTRFIEWLEEVGVVRLV